METKSNKPHIWLRCIGLLGLCSLFLLQPAWSQITGSSTDIPAIHLSPGQEVISLHQKAWAWIDPTGKADLPEAMAALSQVGSAPQNKTLAVRPYAVGENYALHERAMWLRFEIAPPARSEDAFRNWQLQVNLPTMDSAQLYSRNSAGQWQMQQAGDSLPVSQWSLKDRYPLFDLNLGAKQGNDVFYLRLAHGRVPFSAGVQIMTQQAVSASRQTEYLFLGAYFGMCLVIVAICVAYGLAQKYATYLRYGAYVASLGLMQLAYLGLGTQYLTPEWVRWNAVASFVLPSLAVAVGVWLLRGLVKPAMISRKLDDSLRFLFVLQLSLGVIDAVWPSVWGVRISNMVSLLCMSMLYVTLWVCWRYGDEGARWIAVGFAPIVIAGFLPLVRNFGFLSTGFWSMYGVTVGSALEIPILMYVLMLRSSRQRELRARVQALAEHDPLTGLSNERVFYAQLHGSQVRAKRYQHRFGLILIELMNYDWLLKEHGRNVAEKTLVLTGTCIKTQARDVDTAARVDTAKFVLLFEGPANAARLLDVATHILARSLRPADVLPVGVQLKLRLSMSLLPDSSVDSQIESTGEDAPTYLSWLIDKAQTHASAPNKAIRAINF